MRRVVVAVAALGLLPLAAPAHAVTYEKSCGRVEPPSGGWSATIYATKATPCRAIRRPAWNTVGLIESRRQGDGTLPRISHPAQGASCRMRWWHDQLSDEVKILARCHATVSGHRWYWSLLTRGIPYPWQELTPYDLRPVAAR